MKGLKEEVENLQADVYNSFICNCEDLEATKMPCSR